MLFDVSDMPRRMRQPAMLGGRHVQRSDSAPESVTALVGGDECIIEAHR
jgi:hypothetical protein